MKALFKMELARAFKNKLFYISLLIGLVIMGVDFYQNIIPQREYLDKMSSIQSSKLADGALPGLFLVWIELRIRSYTLIYHFIIPMLAALPYSMSIFTDVKSNYINNIIVRTDKKKYYLSKLAVQFLCGGCIATIPLAISFIGTAMVLPAILPQSASSEYAFSKLNLWGDLFYSKPFVFIIVLFVIDFIGFGLINCIAFIFADLLDNRFMVVVSPFIIYFLQYVVCSMMNRESMRGYLLVTNMRVNDVKYVLLDGFILIVAITASYVVRCRRKDVL